MHVMMTMDGSTNAYESMKMSDEMKGGILNVQQLTERSAWHGAMWLEMAWCDVAWGDGRVKSQKRMEVICTGCRAACWSRLLADSNRLKG